MPDPDKELAKLLMRAQQHLAEAQIEIAEQKRAIQMNRIGIKELQDKYEHLLYKIHHPQEVQKSGEKKLLGFQVRASRDWQVFAPGSKETEIMDVLSAVDILLEAQKLRTDWLLSPVFEGDIDHPIQVDRSDIEDGDL